MYFTILSRKDWRPNLGTTNTLNYDGTTSALTDGHRNGYVHRKTGNSGPRCYVSFIDWNHRDAAHSYNETIDILRSLDPITYGLYCRLTEHG